MFFLWLLWQHIILKLRLLKISMIPAQGWHTDLWSIPDFCRINRAFWKEQEKGKRNVFRQSVFTSIILILTTVFYWRWGSKDLGPLIFHSSLLSLAFLLTTSLNDTCICWFVVQSQCQLWSDVLHPEWDGKIFVKAEVICVFISYYSTKYSVLCIISVVM